MICYQIKVLKKITFELNFLIFIKRQKCKILLKSLHLRKII